jgi:hypothetical protein
MFIFWSARTQGTVKKYSFTHILITTLDKKVDNAHLNVGSFYNEKCLNNKITKIYRSWFEIYAVLVSYEAIGKNILYVAIYYLLLKFQFKDSHYYIRQFIRFYLKILPSNEIKSVSSTHKLQLITLSTLAYCFFKNYFTFHKFSGNLYIFLLPLI